MCGYCNHEFQYADPSGLNKHRKKCDNYKAAMGAEALRSGGRSFVPKWLRRWGLVRIRFNKPVQKRMKASSVMATHAGKGAGLLSGFDLLVATARLVNFGLRIVSTVRDKGRVWSTVQGGRLNGFGWRWRSKDDYENPTPTYIYSKEKEPDGLPLDFDIEDGWGPRQRFWDGQTMKTAGDSDSDYEDGGSGPSSTTASSACTAASVPTLTTSKASTNRLGHKMCLILDYFAICSGRTRNSTSKGGPTTIEV